MKANIFKSASVSLRSRPAAGGAGTSGSGGSGNPASSGGGSIRGKPISNPIPIPNALDADGFPPPIRLGIHGASGHSTGSPQPAAEGGAAYGDAPAGVTSEPQLHEQQLYHPPPPVSQQLGGGGGGSGSRTEVESPSAAAVADRGSGGSPRRRTAQHVLNRYSAVSTSTAPTDGTGGSSGAGAPPKRKKSTLRSAIGRLFGRAGSSGRKKSQSSADGGDGAGGEGSAAAGLGQAALNRSDPTVLGHAMTKDGARVNSLPITEYDRALRSHSVGPEDMTAIEDARSTMQNEGSGGRGGPGHGHSASTGSSTAATAAAAGAGSLSQLSGTRRRAATTTSRLLGGTTPTSSRWHAFGTSPGGNGSLWTGGEWTGLSPRPSSTHGRGSRALLSFASAGRNSRGAAVNEGQGHGEIHDPSEIGRAITSDGAMAQQSHRRRSRSLSGLHDLAVASAVEDDGGAEDAARRRSDEIRYWRESYDANFGVASPLSSVGEGTDVGHLQDSTTMSGNVNDDVDASTTMNLTFGTAMQQLLPAPESSSTPGRPTAMRPEDHQTTSMDGSGKDKKPATSQGPSTTTTSSPPPQPFDFGALAGMKITQAASLEARLGGLEERMMRVERLVERLGGGTSGNDKSESSLSEQLVIQNPQPTHPVTTTTANPPPTTPSSSSLLLPQQQQAPQTPPSPLPPHAVTTSVSTPLRSPPPIPGVFRRPSSLSPSRTASNRLRESASSTAIQGEQQQQQQQQQQMASLLSMLEAERAARLELEREVQRLARRLAEATAAAGPGTVGVGTVRSGKPVVVAGAAPVAVPVAGSGGGGGDEGKLGAASRTAVTPPRQTAAGPASAFDDSSCTDSVLSMRSDDDEDEDDDDDGDMPVEDDPEEAFVAGLAPAGTTPPQARKKVLSPPTTATTASASTLTPTVARVGVVDEGVQGMSEPDPDSDSNSDGDRTMTRRAVYGSLVETVRADDDDDGDDEDDDAKATKQSMESEGDEEKQKGKDPGGNGSGNGNGNGNGSGGRRSKHRQKKAARTLSLGQLTMGKVAARAASLVGSNKSRETPSPRQSTAAASPSSNLRLDGSGPGGAHMF